ncbi:MAG: phosphoserine phosphatase [Patescibacteria group bacterium]|nr:phosphoserine phosphatase [Patescibacteria group bacterium]
MKIYFVRHGESLDSANGLFQRSDSGLSEIGIQQAHIIADELKNVKFKIIYTSTLTRAMETADIINKKLMTKVEVLQDLAEEKRPTIIEGKLKSLDENQKVIKEIETNYNDLGWRHSDEDTFEIVKDRARRLANHVSNLKDDTYLLVSDYISM